MALEYKYDPDFIALSRVADHLYAEDYRPRTTYHQVYYAATSGGGGGVQDRTRHWYIHRDKLPNLARLLRLKSPPEPHVWAEDCMEAAESWVNAISRDNGVIFLPRDHAKLVRSAAMCFEAIVDGGHRYHSTRIVEAQRTLDALKKSTLESGRFVGAQRPIPLILPKDLGSYEAFHSYAPAEAPRHAWEDDDSVIEDAA